MESAGGIISQRIKMKSNTLVSSYDIIAGLIGIIFLFLVGTIGGKEV